MSNAELGQALAELQSLRQNVPEADIKEADVVDYHQLLESIAKETSLNLTNFFIPNERLERAITGTAPPSRVNRYQEEVYYSDSRSCDRDFFLRKLDAVIIYIQGLQPKQGIGFKN